MSRYFILNKPPGCITARRDFAGRSTVYDHVPPHFPPLPHVGRLDYNSEGLLLFTDDGRLTQAMLRHGFLAGRDEEDRPELLAGEAGAEPAGRDGTPVVEKVYHVKLRGVTGPDDPRLPELERPLLHPDGVMTRPARVRYLVARSSAAWVEVVLVEGRSRQIRLLCQRSDLLVVKLRRVAFGPLQLGDLKLRWCRPLSRDEVAACYALALPGEPLPPFEPIEDTPEALALARLLRQQQTAGNEGADGPLRRS